MASLSKGRIAPKNTKKREIDLLKSRKSNQSTKVWEIAETVILKTKLKNVSAIAMIIAFLAIMLVLQIAHILISLAEQQKVNTVIHEGR